MIAWICVGIAFVAGFAAGCAFMTWVVNMLSRIEAAIEAGARAATPWH